MDRLKLSLRCALLVAPIVLTTGSALGRDDGRYADSPLKPWFDSLRSHLGPCCSDADGFAVSDPDWESHDGHYRVRLDGLRARGSNMPHEERAAFTDPILATYEREGHPFYSSARLWDDGILDPADTRMALALGLAAAANAPISPTKYGVFRM